MKRSGEWPRKKRLQAKTELKPGSSALSRRTPLTSRQSLEAGKGLKRAELVARKPKRSSEERTARALVWERSAAQCERCGRAPATNWHHRRNRSAGGLWTPENGMALCGTGTTGCHGEVTVNPRISYQQGWSVRSTQDPALAPVWIAGQGFVYLTAAGTYRPVSRSAA